MISIPRQGKNIYLRKDGRWEGRYPKEKVNGKTKYGSVFGKTYEEAEQKLSSIKRDTQIPVFTAHTIKGVSEQWLDSQKPQLKASSYAKYLNLLKLYLMPAFGDVPVQSITRTEVLRFSREMLTEGGIHKTRLAPKTVNSILSVLKSILVYSARELNIPVASIGDVSVRQSSKPMRILSRNEQDVLSRRLYKESSPCSVGILLFLYTGMRIGEVCALTWGDIHFTDQYLFVHMFICIKP